VDAIAVGAAYYAMLYGARAALSERRLHAKTHRGSWNLLRQTLVADGLLAAEAVADAERLAELREEADCDALAVERGHAASGRVRRAVSRVAGRDPRSLSGRHFGSITRRSRVRIAPRY
jgi:uncharacterized protein (UPF0332 family)